MKLSAVVNTQNEARNIVRCLKSVASYVDEIVVVDMQSQDETVGLARKFTDKIYSHPNTGYVEPARNFAINKAKGDWILLIDADEVLTGTLGLKLRRLAEHAQYSFYRIPRKNLIFKKWITHTGWWPDYQIRFFQKDKVTWNDEIHSIPLTEGKGMDLLPEEKNAFIHYHYESISQYLDRLNRYTSQEVKQKIKDNEKFYWKNLISKPAGEFITRFFAHQGYKDGIHGLVLSLLQGISFFITEIKFWEQTGFSEVDQTGFLDNVGKTAKIKQQEACFWYYQIKAKSSSGVLKYIYKILARIRL